MALAVGDSIQSEQSVLSDKPWFQRLEEAFAIWSEGRQLKQASIEDKAMIHLTSVRIMKHSIETLQLDMARSETVSSARTVSPS